MQLKSKKDLVIEKLQTLSKGDVVFVARTIQDAAVKKSRVTKLPTPQKYSKIEKLCFTTVSIGNDYAEEVEKKIGTPYNPNGTYCVSLDKIETGVKGLITSALAKIGITLSPKLSKIIYKYDDTKYNNPNCVGNFYVRVYPDLATTKVNSVTLYFDANGDEIPAAEWKNLKEEYFKKTYSSSTGVKVLNYKLENVLLLKDNSVVNELTQGNIDLLMAKI